MRYWRLAMRYWRLAMRYFLRALIGVGLIMGIAFGLDIVLYSVFDLERSTGLFVLEVVIIIVLWFGFIRKVLFHD